jgi:hypothetical protein
MGFQHDINPFPSVKGYAEFAHAHEEPGDCIYTIFSSTLVFALRTITGGMLGCIGDVNVHGIMDRECWNKGSSC